MLGVEGAVAMPALGYNGGGYRARAHLGGVDDASLQQVLVDAGLCVVAHVDVARVQHLREYSRS